MSNRNREMLAKSVAYVRRMEIQVRGAELAFKEIDAKCNQESGIESWEMRNEAGTIWAELSEELEIEIENLRHWEMECANDAFLGL